MINDIIYILGTLLLITVNAILLILSAIGSLYFLIWMANKVSDWVDDWKTSGRKNQ